MKQKSNAELVEELEQLRRRVADLESEGGAHPPPGDEPAGKNRYREVVRTSMAGFWLIDMEGRFLDVNAAYCRLSGYSREELLRMRIRDVEAMETPEETARHITAITEEGYDRFETKHRRKDGATVDVEVSASLSDVEDGRIVAFVRDITRSKRAEEELTAAYQQLQASNQQLKATEQQLRASNQQLEASNRQLRADEEALRRSETLYRRLVQHLPQRIFIKDRNSVFVSCNANFAHDSGLEPEQVIGKDDFALYPRELAEAYRADDRAVMEAGQPKVIEEPVPARGETRWVHTIKVPFHDERGNVIGVLGIFEDVTERRQAEESARLLATIVESSEDAILSKTLDGVVTSWNAGAEKLYGYPAEEAVGRRIAFLVPPDRTDELPEILRRLARGELVEHLETVRVRKDGTVVEVSLTVSPIKDESGGVVGASSIARDITERKRREERNRLTREVLEELTRPGTAADSARSVLKLIGKGLDFEATGIRLRDGDDYPYCETSGFDDEFVELERHLCVRDRAGDVARDTKGNPVLECMCGNVILGRVDPSLPFFTEGGSFWTNSTTELLASTTEADRQARTRNRCHGEGYESVALIPLRSGSETVGLLQLNDHRWGKFTPELVQYLEGLGVTIGIALARERAQEELEAVARFPSEDPSPILRISEDGNLLYVNPKGAELLTHWRLKAGQPAPQTLRDVADRALTDGTAQAVEIEHDGRLYLFDVVPLAGAGYATLYGRDITGLRRAEDALRRSERKFRAMVENVGIGVALIAPDMRILELNRKMHDWFPQVDTTAYPPCYKVIQHPPRQEACEACPVRATLDDGQVHEATKRLATPLGDRIFRIVSTPVRNDQGEVTAAIQMMEDMTDHLSMEDQLRQAQKMEAVGQLAGGVAHDFNNLLTGIGGFVGFARDAVELGSPAYDDLGKVLGLVDRAAALTRQLLAFSRRQMLEPVVLDVNELLSEQVKLLRRLLGEDIDLQFAPAPQLRNVCADPGQIEQIVLNLAVNARDAMPTGGRLIIETADVELSEDYVREHAEATGGPHVMIAMSDTGCGMDAETRQRIFEPFFTTKERGKGTGLGLATVYGIVKQHNGSIQVYSEEGKGTTFRIYVPSVGRQAEERPTRTEFITGGTETILLVEDEEAIRAISCRRLELLGYDVLCAAGPDEAEQMAAEHGGPLDLLLTDVVMPGRNGRELYESLQSRQPGLKVLYMSGYTDKAVLRDGLLGEHAGMLQKPFGQHDLAAKVRQALDR